LTTVLSHRIKDAKKLVERNSVKKYIIDERIERWVVVGNSKEYLVFIDPFWCRCFDFQRNVLNNRVSLCKHNIAVKIAIQEEKYDTFNLSKDEYDYIRSDFLLS
jgi:predicted nucleic acid-binding Zn finger protein